MPVILDMRHRTPEMSVTNLESLLASISALQKSIKVLEKKFKVLSGAHKPKKRIKK